MPELKHFLRSEFILMGLKASTKGEAIRALTDRICRQRPGLDAAAVFDAVMARENLSSTFLGGGVAIPHALIECGDETSLGIALLDRPVDFGSSDSNMVDIIFIIVGSRSDSAFHLKLLSKLARILHHEDFRDVARQASSPEELMRLIRERE